MTALTYLTLVTIVLMKSFDRLRAFACRIASATPELSFRGSATAHGLLTLWAWW